jgi:hypothetical protein
MGKSSPNPVTLIQFAKVELWTKPFDEGDGQSRVPEVAGPARRHDGGGDPLISGAALRPSLQLPGVRRPAGSLLCLGRQVFQVSPSVLENKSRFQESMLWSLL